MTPDTAYFFGALKTFATTAKSAKGAALISLAINLNNVVIEGANAPEIISCALQDAARAIDSLINRARETYIHLTYSGNGGGQISAVPISDALEAAQPYFRIYYQQISRRVTIADAREMLK